MVAYEFYWHDEIKGYELLGVLPERRKNPVRITEKSILGWVDKVFGNKLRINDIYFIQGTINENIGMTFRPPPASSGDITESLGRAQMESIGLDEMMERTSKSLHVDLVKCISCGRQRSEHEMQKVFYERHKGICKTCFKFGIDE